MHAEILKKQQEAKWDQFAYTHPYSSIHQTTRWAHFQSNVPARDKFWIIALFDENNKIIGGTILIKHKLPWDQYCWLYSPRGPLLSYEDPKLAKEQMKVLLQKIKSIANEEKAIFYRIDPLIKKHPHKAHRYSGFHKTRLGFQPEDTLIIDISQPHKDILDQMKQKGRYNIRLAEKKHVKLIEVTTPSLRSNKGTVDLIRGFQAHVESYFEILQETLERDRFYGHSISFYKNMIEKLAPEDKLELKSQLKKGFAKLYLAEYTPPETHKTKCIAGIIITFYKDTAIYYYGASSNEHRNVMAPYALQWHAIKEAARLGCKHYDLLGIAPPAGNSQYGQQKHPWRGVTEFKRKFGGTHVSYLPAQEYSFKPLLHLAYRMAKFLSKLKKKLYRRSGRHPSDQPHVEPLEHSGQKASK